MDARFYKGLQKNKIYSISSTQKSIKCYNIKRDGMHPFIGPYIHKNCTWSFQLLKEMKKKMLHHYEWINLIRDVYIEIFSIDQSNKLFQWRVQSLYCMIRFLYVNIGHLLLYQYSFIFILNTDGIEIYINLLYCAKKSNVYFSVYGCELFCVYILYFIFSI